MTGRRQVGSLGSSCRGVLCSAGQGAYGVPPEVAGNANALANSIAVAGGAGGGYPAELLTLQAARAGPPANANSLTHQLMGMNMGGGPPGYGVGAPLGGPRLGGLGGDMAGRPWGQKISSHDKMNEWKLFVGQVPLEVRASVRACACACV